MLSISPEKAKQRAIFRQNVHLMKHFTDIAAYGHCMLAKLKQYSQERRAQCRAWQQEMVEDSLLVLKGAAEDQAGFIVVVHHTTRLFQLVDLLVVCISSTWVR